MVLSTAVVATKLGAKVTVVATRVCLTGSVSTMPPVSGTSDCLHQTNPKLICSGLGDSSSGSSADSNSSFNSSSDQYSEWRFVCHLSCLCPIPTHSKAATGWCFKAW